MKADKIIFLIVFVLTLGAGGYFVYLTHLGKAVDMSEFKLVKFDKIGMIADFLNTTENKKIKYNMKMFLEIKEVGDAYIVVSTKGDRTIKIHIEDSESKKQLIEKLTKLTAKTTR